MLHLIDNIDTYKRYGRVKKAVGLMIESQGPESSIGDICYIHAGKDKVIPAEVVGFKEEKILLMPYTSVQEISPGSLVEATLKPLEVRIGPGLIGKVVDFQGIPLDGSRCRTV